MVFFTINPETVEPADHGLRTENGSQAKTSLLFFWTSVFVVGLTDTHVIGHLCSDVGKEDAESTSSK